MSMFASFQQCSSQITFAFHGEPALFKHPGEADVPITICRTTETSENNSVTVGERKEEIISVVAYRADMEPAVLMVTKIALDDLDWTIKRIAKDAAETCLVTLSRKIAVEKARPNYRGAS